MIRLDEFVRYWSGDEAAVIVHGSVTRIEQDSPEFEELDSFRLSLGRQSLHEWSPTAFYARDRPDAALHEALTRTTAPAC